MDGKSLAMNLGSVFGSTNSHRLPPETAVDDYSSQLFFRTRFKLSVRCISHIIGLERLCPKVNGSRFTVHARPGATRLKHIKTNARFLNLGLYNWAVQSQVWARGSKVVRFWYCLYCKTLIALATFTHLSAVQDFRLRESAEASAEELGRRVGCSNFTAPIDALSLWCESVIVFQPWTVNAEPFNPGIRYIHLVKKATHATGSFLDSLRALC